MGMNATYTFGPGRLESLTLTRPNPFTGHLSGSYRVYCGMGWEHTAEIDITHEFQAVLDNEQMVEELLAFALEDWLDPCEGEE